MHRRQHSRLPVSSPTPLAFAAAALLLLCCSAVAAERYNAAAPRYKILTIIPVGGSSHSFDLVAVAGRLAKRHDVTIATPVTAVGHTTAAVRRLGDLAGPVDIVPVDALVNMQEFVAKLGKKPARSFLDIIKTFTTIPSMMAERCEVMIANSTLLEEWRSYDALLTFIFPPPAVDSCTCLLAHALGIPLLYVRDIILMDSPIDVPQFGSGLSRSRVRGTWSGAIMNAGYWLLNQVLIKVLEHHEVKSLRALRGRLGLQLGARDDSGEPRTCIPAVEVVSGNWLFEEPQPIAPPQVMVGPISPHPSHPAIADPQVAQFADEAAVDGLVLVSFGSVSSVFGAQLNMDDYKGLALAFADVAPVRVLWLLNPSALPQGSTPADLPLGPNTLLVPWAAVNDILGHTSCGVFVTHGGQKSLYEAMHHGVPIVGVPFMMEQLQNTRRAAVRGFGVVSDESAALRKPGVRFTRESMAALIRKALSPSYAAAAHQIGEAMRLAYQHKKPVDRAAEEIELAMVHGGYSVQHSLQQAKLREERHHCGQQAGRPVHIQGPGSSHRVAEDEEAGGAALVTQLVLGAHTEL